MPENRQNPNPSQTTQKLELKNMKKKSLVRDMADMTALATGGAIYTSTVYSLPSTPQAPALESAKAFGGQAIGLATTIKGASMLMKSVKELEKIGKKGLR
jgi:hypothetical protein